MAGNKNSSTTDNILEKILNAVSGGVRIFTSFLFFWLALGMIIGMALVAFKPSLAIPAIIGIAIAGLISYYNTTFAIIVLAIFLLVFIPL